MGMGRRRRKDLVRGGQVIVVTRTVDRSNELGLTPFFLFATLLSQVGLVSCTDIVQQGVGELVRLKVGQIWERG